MTRSHLALAVLLVVATSIAATAGLALPFAHADAAAEDATAKTATYRSGTAPMPNDAPVPDAWMPPGSDESPMPSDEIFPPQSITVRFNHKKHVKDLGLSCKTCHAGAYTSMSSSDRMMPSPKDTCDGCHDVSHADLSKVTAGKDPNGQCTFCHLGDNAGVGGKVAPLVLPPPNLRFPHKKHLDRNIQCGHCHGKIDELELATREQLPRMAGCFDCHAMPGQAQGDARSECTVCHLTEPTGKLQLEFTTGELLPPDWLHMAGHTPDWIERHKTVAANDSRFCASCHKEEDCAECHDGRVRNRKVHPNDWISMHATAARLDNPRCVSCHQLTSFCGDCHRRVGVARDAPVGERPGGARFHPPPSEWTLAPRGPNHHAWEAERNINACVACHSERDCATCHATKGLSGGAGVSPHPNGFKDRCSVPFQRNPRPCLVCHQGGDAKLASCK